VKIFGGVIETISLEKKRTVWRAWGEETKLCSRASTRGARNSAATHGTKNTTPSMRIIFTDQLLTSHEGLIVWSHFPVSPAVARTCPTIPSVPMPAIRRMGRYKTVVFQFQQCLATCRRTPFYQLPDYDHASSRTVQCPRRTTSPSSRSVACHAVSSSPAERLHSLPQLHHKKELQAQPLTSPLHAVIAEAIILHSAPGKRPVAASDPTPSIGDLPA
jgi:hypothetical protein